MKAIHSLFLALLLPGAGLAQDIEPQTAWPAFKRANPGAWKVVWSPATGTPSAIMQMIMPSRKANAQYHSMARRCP